MRTGERGDAALKKYRGGTQNYAVLPQSQVPFAGTAVSILVSPSLQFVSIEGNFCLLLGCGAIILCDIECVKSIYRIMTM